jgi:hypothetical protein
LELPKEMVREMARLLGLRVEGEGDLDVLIQVIDGNEAFLVAVDYAKLRPGDDPFYFVTYLQGRREERGG